MIPFLGKVIHTNLLLGVPFPNLILFQGINPILLRYWIRFDLFHVVRDTKLGLYISFWNKLGRFFFFFTR